MLSPSYSSSNAPAYAASLSLQSLGHFPESDSTSAFGAAFLHNGALALDPNSPEAFRQNIQLAHNHVLRVQDHARAALACM